jgi:alkyl hydroperoxide reductase subunit AhpF
MPKLEVYISKGCWNCDESQRIVADMRAQFPKMNIRLHDMTDDELPGNVFAVPTYVLNGRVLYVGNPRPDELKARLATAQPAR